MTEVNHEPVNPVPRLYVAREIDLTDGSTIISDGMIEGPHGVTVYSDSSAGATLYPWHRIMRVRRY